MTRILFLPGAGGSPDFWKPVSALLPADWSKEYFGWPGLGHQPHDPSIKSIDDLKGLTVRGDRVFRGRDPDYRAIPGTTQANDLLCSHISINFDRNGFQEDWNVIFPLDRLNELAADGTIGSVAATHYSFMGATDPVQMVDCAREVAGKLRADHVDAVLLTSV